MSGIAPAGATVSQKNWAASKYDRLSRFYDPLARLGERRRTEAGLRMLGVQVGETVLKIEFGTGHGLASLAQAAGPLGRVCGLDISLAVCRREGSDGAQVAQ